MKKIYSFMAMLLLFMGVATSAFAEEHVNTITDKGPEMTDVSELTVGKKVVFYNMGRNGYVYEDNDKLWLGETLPVNIAAGFRTIFEVASAEGGEYVFKTPGGAFIGPLNKGNQSGLVTDIASAAKFTFTPGTEAGVWNILDQSNALYFNGNGPLSGNFAPFGKYSTFVGWDQAGGNSNYKVYFPTTLETVVYTVETFLVDEEDNVLPGNSTLTQKGGTGDSVRVPSYTAYTLIEALDGDGNPVTYPFEITEDKQITARFKRNPPHFQPTTIAGGQFDPNTTYYFLTIRGGHYIYYAPDSTEAQALIRKDVNVWEEDKVDNYLWAFVGDFENGFKLYNKGAGTSLVLTNEGDAEGALNNLLAENGDDSRYVYTEKGEGFVLSHWDTQVNAYINQYGGATKELLKFWADEASANDGGSLFKVIKYDADSLNQLKIDNALAKYKEIVNAAEAVGGYTTAQVAPIKAAVEANDSTAAKAAYEALVASGAQVKAFDASKTYVVVSATDRGENGTTKYALNFSNKEIPAEDSVLRMTWGELPANYQEASAAADYKWKFNAAGNLTPLSTKQELAADTIFIGLPAYYLENQSDKDGQKYYAGLFEWGTKAPMIAKDSINMVLKEGAVFGSFAICHIHERLKEDGTYGHARTTLSFEQGQFNPKKTSGTLTSYNVLDSKYATSWYLYEVPEVTTGINATVVNEAAKNGKTEIYDITGRKVSKATKGLYIINGKKVLVK